MGRRALSHFIAVCIAAFQIAFSISANAASVDHETHDVSTERTTAVLTYNIPLAAMLLIGIFSAEASFEKSLASTKGCMSCHRQEGRKIGPAFRTVGQKYRGKVDGDISQTLTRKIMGEGTEHPGENGPPVHRALGLTEAEATKLVTWILSLK